MTSHRLSHLLFRSLLALMLFGMPLASAGCQAKPLSEKEKTAQELDNLLGNNTPDAQPPVQEEAAPADPFSGFPDWAQKMAPGQPGIDITEETQAYKLTIDLSNPQDANTVKLNVLPHRVEISGQSSFGKDGFQGSSSFFKSFSTSAELVPSGLKREQTDKQLLFVIPKKVASSPTTPRQTTPSPHNKPVAVPQQISPDVLKQLDNTPGRAI